MELIIIGKSAPLNSVVGRHWLHPDTGQAYVYLNGDWRPFVGGDTFELSYNYPLTILIGGVDRTGYIDQASLTKSDILTSQVDTCTFVLVDDLNEVILDVGQEVQIYWKSAPAADEELIFGGEISTAPKKAIAPGLLAFEYEINCVDYSKRLNSKLAVQSYTEQLAGDIIKDLIDTYLPGSVTTVNVQDGETVAYISFNYKTVGECIKELAELTGYDWYVDYNKDIHFFSKETNSAPYQLTEDIATTGHYRDLTIDVDKSQIRNTIYVRGGNYLSDLFTEELVADGVQKAFLLAYKPNAPITVYVDSGAGYVLHTLGVDSIDDSGKDFVVNYNSRMIKNLDHAILTAGHKIKVTYKYEIQVLTVDTDYNSIAELQLSEGGDGVYQYLITDSDIVTVDAAHDRALAELNQYASPIISGNFATDQDGYRSGQLLTINMPNWGYTNKQYMIQQVDAVLKTDNKFEYQITFATVYHGLTDLLTEMLDRGQEIIVRENETLHELDSNLNDVITLSHNDPTFESEEPPFKWGPGYTPKGVWNESTWG